MNGANAAPPGWPPLRNAHAIAPVAAEDNCTEAPAATFAWAGAPAVMVRAGKGVIAKLEPDGHEEMKPAAREKTARMPRGVSKGPGMAAALEAVRMKVLWRASTVTISAATVRIPGVLTRGAAARYLHHC